MSDSKVAQLEAFLRRTTADLLDAEKRLESLDAARHEPIAIVGMACRLPGGVMTPEDYWKLLAQGRDAVGPFPSRWDADAIYDPDPEAVGKSVTRQGGFIEDIDLFDASFFGIPPKEANAMDPQQRIILETTWEALERSGIEPASLRGSATGVYVGSDGTDYGQEDPSLESLDGHRATGGVNSVLSGRISYLLGLHGPAMTLDTACSSSLVALHLACSALRQGECERAVVVGSQVMTTPGAFISFSRLRALAPDGRCKSFSAAADGTGWGEGVCALVLLPLSVAKKSGHTILGLVRGTAVNQDGKSQGLTAPHGPSQEKVVRQALESSQLGPADIDHIEAHGTGTVLGDPIEASALGQIFGARPKELGPVYLGSAKSNLGHTRAAAGLAGVIKVVLSLQNETLPKTLHAEEPSPHIEWPDTGLQLLQQARPWQRRDGHTRRGGVSSFGFSGTNAHAIIEEAPEPKDTQRADGEIGCPLILSAKSQEALRSQAERWASWLALNPDVSWPDVLHTAATTRTHFETRASVTARDVSAAKDVLQSIAQGKANRDAVISTEGRPGKLAFLFTGQGSQMAQMGAQLYREHPVFEMALDVVARALDVHLETPLLEVMFAEEGSEKSELIDQTAYTQPALFALEVTMARLWQLVGVQPDVLLGHSIGELTAAHISGVLNLKDAAKLVCARGRLMQGCEPGGAMASLEATEAEVREALANEPGRVDIAGLNGPKQTVISGDGEAVERVMEHFRSQDRKVTALKVSHAFHSAHMDTMLTEFAEVAATCTFSEPRIAVVSNVTGKEASAEELQSPAYWVRHVREAVRFVDGMQRLSAMGVKSFVECGPRGVLCAMGAGCIDDTSARFIASHRKTQGELGSLSRAMGQVYVAGHALDWDVVVKELGGQWVDLPTYAFQRKRYWLESAGRAGLSGTRSAGAWPLAGQELVLPGGGTLHLLDIGPGVQRYLGDHLVYERVVVPGAFYVGVLLSLGASRWPERTIELTDVQFIEALFFDRQNERAPLHVHLQPEGDDSIRATLAAYRGDSWTTHVTAIMRVVGDYESETLNLDGQSLDVLEEDVLVGMLEALDITWGPQWRWLREVGERGEGRIGKLVVPDGVPEDAPIPGGLLDNSFSVPFRDNHAEGDDPVPRLPFRLDRVVWYGERASIGWVTGEPRSMETDTQSADLAYWDNQGRLVARIEGFMARRAPKHLFMRGSSNPLYQINWQRVSEPTSASEAAAMLVLGTEGLLSEALGVAVCDSFDAVDTPPQRWLIDATAHDDDAAEQAKSICEETLALVQAWLQDSTQSETELVVVTRQSVACRPGEPVPGLAGAALSGLIRSARHEEQDRIIRWVDVPDGPIDQELLDLALAQSDEPELAIRAESLLIPRLGRALSTEQDASTLPELSSGAVLVTGGTGAIGQRLARHLIECHRVRHLVLTSRRGEDAPGMRELRDELTALGAESVVIASCDVASRGEVDALMARFTDEIPLSGVIHLAGVIQDGLI